jgi:hypothetical protein
MSAFSDVRHIAANDGQQHFCGTCDQETSNAGLFPATAG